MSTLCDFQARLSALFAEAAAQGLKPAEILPEELQGHGSNALKNANDYIKELEECEATKRENIIELQKELNTTKEALENIPADYQSALSDLKQANISVNFYRDLFNQSEEYAQKLQAKLRTAEEKMRSIQTEKDKFYLLENEKLDLEISLEKLLNDREKLMEDYENFREQDQQILAAKEERLAETEKAIRELRNDKEKLEETLEAEAKAHTASKLLIERELILTVKTSNLQALYIERENSMRMATISEILPLVRVFEHCAITVDLIYEFIQQLLSPRRRDLHFQLEHIEKLSRSVLKDLEVYHELRECFDNETLERDEVRENFAGLARSGTHMQLSLDMMSRDIKQYMCQLDRRPDLLAMLSYKFPKLKRLSLQ